MNETDPILAYGISDASRLLSLGRTKIYALIGAGRIQALQCDGRTLIPAESIRAFIANLPPAPIRRRDAA